jgi:hypothetical protein
MRSLGQLNQLNFIRLEQLEGIVKIKKDTLKYYDSINILEGASNYFHSHTYNPNQIDFLLSVITPQQLKAARN